MSTDEPDNQSHNPSSTPDPVPSVPHGDVDRSVLDQTREHMYLLPEEDLRHLLQVAAEAATALGDASMGVDAALLTVWEEGYHIDLDGVGEGMPLANLVASAPELPPEALHAIIFTYMED